MTSKEETGSDNMNWPTEDYSFESIFGKGVAVILRDLIRQEVKDEIKRSKKRKHRD